MYSFSEAFCQIHGDTGKFWMFLCNHIKFSASVLLFELSLIEMGYHIGWYEHTKCLWDFQGNLERCLKLYNYPTIYIIHKIYSFLTKAPKTFNGQKTASSTNIARKTGCLHAENSNIILVFHLVKVSTQSDLRTLI
jgi:hypothetical protein